jgi:hypothetical protein
MTPLVAQIQRLSGLASYEQLVSAVESEDFERISVPPLPPREAFENIASDSFRRNGLLVLLQKNAATEFGKKWSVTSISVLDKAASLTEVVREVSEWLGADPEYPARSAQFFFVESDKGRTFMSMNESLSWHENPIGSLISLSIGDSPAVSVLRMETRPA